MSLRRKFAAAATLIHLGLAIVLLSYERDPTYQGQTLDEWVIDYNQMTGAGLHSEADHLRRAIAEFGKENLDYVIARLNEPDRARTLTETAFLLSLELGRRHRLNDLYQSYQRKVYHKTRPAEAAATCLWLTGTNAAPMVAEIFKIYDSDLPRSHYVSPYLLGPIALEPLLARTRSPNPAVVHRAIVELANMGREELLRAENLEDWITAPIDSQTSGMPEFYHEKLKAFVVRRLASGRSPYEYWKQGDPVLDPWEDEKTRNILSAVLNATGLVSAKREIVESAALLPHRADEIPESVLKKLFADSTLCPAAAIVAGQRGADTLLPLLTSAAHGGAAEAERSLILLSIAWIASRSSLDTVLPVLEDPSITENWLPEPPGPQERRVQAAMMERYGVALALEDMPEYRFSNKRRAIAKAVGLDLKDGPVPLDFNWKLTAMAVGSFVEHSDPEISSLAESALERLNAMRPTSFDPTE